MPHAARPKLARRHPVHVTLRLRTELPNLRRARVVRMLRGCFAKGAERFGFRLAHFSVQGRHLHLIAEAEDERALARGLQGLTIRVAKGLNRLWERKGTVFAERYHARILRTPLEVRRALVYVLQNAWHHGQRLQQALDVFSSAAWFDGWREEVITTAWDGIARPVAAPRSWLLRVGWRRHGAISVYEHPSPA